MRAHTLYGSALYLSLSLYPLHLSLSLLSLPPSLFLSFYLSLSPLSLLFIILFDVSNGRFRPCFILIPSDLITTRGGFRVLVRGLRDGERSEPKFFGPPPVNFWPPLAGGCQFCTGGCQPLIHKHTNIGLTYDLLIVIYHLL